MRHLSRSHLLIGIVLLLVAGILLFFWTIPALKTLMPSGGPTGEAVPTATTVAQLTMTPKSDQRTPSAGGTAAHLPISYPVLGFICLAFALLLFWVTQSQRRRPSTAHGSAHWATIAEVWQANVVTTRWQEKRAQSRAQTQGERPPSRLPLGTYKGLRLALSERQQESHVSLIAPTGKGKTSTMMIPALLAERGSRSLFINDTKGELVQKTWGALSQHVTCYQFAPTEPKQSHCYNPLAHIRTMDDAEDLADSLIANTGKSPDPFWDNAAKLLLTGVILHLTHTEQNPPFQRLVDLLCGTAPEKVKEVLATSPSTLVQKVSVLFVSSLTKSDKLEGAVFSELASRLFRMHNPSIVAVTSKNEIDFQRVMAEPSALFVHIPQGDVERLKWLSATLIMQLMKALTQAAQKRPDKRLSRPFVFYLDEFCNAGHIPGFTKHISLVRSAGIAFILAMQDFGQLESEYGEEGKNSILSNSTHKLFFPGCGLPESEYASKLAGETTVLTYSESERADTQGRLFAPSSRSQASSETRRPLLTPDEVRRLRKGTALLFSDTTPPILLHTRSYLENPALLDQTTQPATLPCGPAITGEENDVRGTAREAVGGKHAAPVPHELEAPLLPTFEEE